MQGKNGKTQKNDEKGSGGMVKCANCDRWYRISGSVRGQCFKQKKKITLYSDDCEMCPKANE